MSLSYRVRRLHSRAGNIGHRASCYHSQAGNVSFPRWEYFIPKQGKTVSYLIRFFMLFGYMFFVNS